MIGCSATKIIGQIASGDISAREVVEAHIARIEEVNPALNALVVERFEAARLEADAADHARSDGQPLGPLHGLPITIKEQFNVTGLPTTMGLHGYKDNIASTDGPLVAKLRKAGAIILGKTNVMQLLAGHVSDNPLYGRTNNPWDLTRTPGGSSGGEAAIIAASGSSLGLGGDLGGSIRGPAHNCGIHGIKPTAHRLPGDDTPGQFFATGQTAIIPQPGPMARHVEDLILAMDVLAGPYEGNLRAPAPPVPWPDPAQVDLKGLTIGLLDDNGITTPSPALQRAIREAGTFLAARGAKVRPFTPPNLLEAFELFFALLGGDRGRKYKEVLGREKPNDVLKLNISSMSIPALVRPLVVSFLRLAGQPLPATVIAQAGTDTTHKYWKAVEKANAYRHTFDQAMIDQGIDVLLLPPNTTVAAPHQEAKNRLDAFGYLGIFNVLGHPAGTVSVTRVRAGEEGNRPKTRDSVIKAIAAAEKGSRGLPLGVQVVARHWREDIVLKVMQALEEDFRGTEDYPSWQHLENMAHVG